MEVDIENVEGIEDIVFKMAPNTGGIKVIKGENGAGKSTAINALNGIMAGSGKLGLRDGAKKGKIEAFGRKASVTEQRTTYSKDDLEVPTLDENFTFDDLVNTQGKEPETRDKVRIKTLLQLTSTKADPSLFYDLAGGKEALEALVTAKDLATPDIVDLASKVSSGLHAAKRNKQSDAEHHEGHAKACQEIADQAPAEVDVPLEQAQSESEAAAAVLQRLKSEVEASAERKKLIATLEASLKTMSDGDGPMVASLEAELNEASEQWARKRELVAHLEANLVIARNECAQRETEHIAITKRLVDAQSREDQLETLSTKLEEARKAESEAPTELAISLAESSLEQWRQRVAEAIRARDGETKRKEAAEYKQKAKAARREAERFEEAAKACGDVLTKCLPPGPLRWKDGQLVLDTERRGKDSPFDKCSAGEQVNYCLPYGINNVGKGGVICLSQAAWQDLDAKARRNVYEQVKKAKVWIVTGEVAEGDLRAEDYQPN